MLFGQWDRFLTLWINIPAGQSALLDRVVIDLGETSLVQGGIFLAIYWWMWFEASPERRRIVVAAIVSAVIVAVAARGLQIGLPFHRRPLHTPGLPIHLPLGVDPATLNHFSSFPSDHAMLFFALSVPLWQRSRWLGTAAMIWTLLVICLPRVYLGYHYPSDVLGGAIIGVALMLALCWALARSRLPDRIVDFATTHPAVFYGVAFPVTYELATLFYDIRHFTVDAAALMKTFIV
jgi:undecaprenyl-diphosphatase